MKDEGNIKVNRIQPVSPQVTRLKPDERRTQQLKKHNKGSGRAGRHFKELA